MIHRKILFVVAIFILSLHAHSQSYYFRKYQVENGLSNNATICCLPDHNGFLWLGTKDGLNRFDGYSFKVFRNDRNDSGSIGNNFVHSLYEDRNQTLWIGTESGLYKYDAVTERFSLLKGTINGRVRDIKMDKSGNLWFILGFTLFKYSLSQKKLIDYPINKYFETTSISISPGGDLWLSTPAGLLKKYYPRDDSFHSFDMFQHSPVATSRWIEKIYCTADNRVMVGTSNQGVKLFNIASSTYSDILTYNSNKTEIFARNFIQTKADEFWIATETGVYIYNTTTTQAINLQKKINDPNSISDNAVYSFCKDKEGGIWVSTYFGGINYYPKQYTPFKKYFPQLEENSISGNVVREIHRDNEGNLWIGTEDAGLNELDAKSGLFKSFRPTGGAGSISYTNIHGLLVDGDELWVGTFEHGLDILDIKTGKVVRHYGQGAGPNELKSNFIYCISKTAEGDILVGTTRGVYSFNRQAKNFTPLGDMPLNNWYSCIFKDDQGIIWAGTYGNGVNFYNAVTKKSGNLSYSPTVKNSICSDRINSIFEDSNKNLWFATEGGLARFNRKSNDFKIYTTKQQFPSNFILNILEDARKNLWISTSKGLVCFDTKSEKLKVYTTVNGTLNDQFNFNSAYKDGDGRMYFGSVKGMISFNPEEFLKNDFIPPVYITSFQVFNKDLPIAEDGSPLQKSITYTDKVVLDYDQSTINIGFAALSYSAPEMSEYSYQMEGLDKRWTYLERNRNAYFTHLSPGTYIFKVKASNSSGVWNNKETRIVIQILPPWWRSKWAYAAYLVIMVVLAALGLQYYHNLQEQKSRRKFEFLERAKEKEVFKAKMDFFTNVAHEIKTPLTLIKAPLEKVIKKAEDMPSITTNLKIMERNTERLISLTNQLLDFRETEIEGFRLSFTKANISEILEDTYSSFKPLAEEKKLAYLLDLPPTPLFASVDLDAFNKIISNLFSNAIKYAESKVTVGLHPANNSDKFFTIEIRNDGFLIPAEMKEKIFEPFYRLKETRKQKGTGIGLSLARSLTLLHKGKLQLEEWNGHNNVFSLTLPVKQADEISVPMAEEESKL